MKIECGVHTDNPAIKLRVRLSLQSEDVETHSQMSDHDESFYSLLQMLQAICLKEFARSPEIYYHEKRP